MADAIAAQSEAAASLSGKASTPTEDLPDYRAALAMLAGGAWFGDWLLDDVVVKLGVGLAAGFDKSAEAFDSFGRMGFGFVEIGSGTGTSLKMPLSNSAAKRSRGVIGR